VRKRTPRRSEKGGGLEARELLAGRKRNSIGVKRSSEEIRVGDFLAKDLRPWVKYRREQERSDKSTATKERRPQVTEMARSRVWLNLN